MNKFSPVMHPTLNDHHRVPITYINGRYEVFVGDNQIRIYNDDELPDILKSRLAMIKASNKKPPTEDPILIAKAYEHPPDSNMFEIGWQPCEGLFVVVIPTKDLTYMRGKYYPPDSLTIEAFLANALNTPTFKFLETYIEWLHLNRKSKQE
jgi:hypothetical protein